MVLEPIFFQVRQTIWHCLLQRIRQKIFRSNPEERATELHARTLWIR